MSRPGDDWTCCPLCGGPLARVERGGTPRPSCAACDFVFFLNPGVGAAVVIRDRNGRVLLVERAAGHFGAGRWCFPCGYVEWGEDVRAAAAREAREEAGIRVAIGDVLQVASNFHEPAKPTIGVWFRATLVDAAAMPVAGDDAVAVGWFDPRRPPPLAFPTDAALIARLAARRRVSGASRSARRRRRDRRRPAR